MSHIAAALAKSKGKAVQPVPDEVPKDRLSAGVSRPPMSMPAMKGQTGGDSAKRKLIGGVALAVVLVSGGVWFLFGRETPKPAPTPAKVTATPTAKSGQPAKVVDFAKPDAKSAAASTAKTAPISAPAATAAAEPAATSDEIFTTVKNFSVSAVKTGENARALINGKTYHTGDTVAPGITLHEIKDGLLIFTDDAGTAYPRRF